MSNGPDYEALFHRERTARLDAIEHMLSEKSTRAEVVIAKEAADQATALVRITAEEQYERLNNLRRDMATKEQVEAIELTVNTRADGVEAALTLRIDHIEKLQNRAVGVGLVLVPLAGVAGAVVLKILGG